MAFFQGCCATHDPQCVDIHEHSDPADDLPPTLQIIDLSANENPFGPSPRALAAITQAAQLANRYPDKEASALKNALARRFGVRSEEVMVGNGSAELIDAIARATLRPGDEAIVGMPSFPAYRSSILRAGAEITAVALVDDAEDLASIAQQVNQRTRLILLGNPNNPSGGTFAAPTWAEFIAKVPENVVVVVDEAYYEYVSRRDFPRPLVQVAAGRNVIVLRSFSKAYGLAGLRIGYGIAPVPLRQRIEKQLQHFNTNRIAQAAALAALSDEEHLARCIARNAQGRSYLQRELARMGFSANPSQANFLLVRIPNAGQVCEGLRRRGVLVKWLEPFGLPDAFRVSVGTAEENEQFLQAFASAINESDR
jgi:histidinol-phosphate aminotransferase